MGYVSKWGDVFKMSQQYLSGLWSGQRTVQSIIYRTAAASGKLIKVAETAMTDGLVVLIGGKPDRCTTNRGVKLSMFAPAVWELRHKEARYQGWNIIKVMASVPPHFDLMLHKRCPSLRPAATVTLMPSPTLPSWCSPPPLAYQYSFYTPVSFVEILNFYWVSSETLHTYRFWAWYEAGY